MGVDQQRHAPGDVVDFGRDADMAQPGGPLGQDGQRRHQAAIVQHEALGVAAELGDTSRPAGRLATARLC